LIFRFLFVDNCLLVMRCYNNVIKKLTYLFGRWCNPIVIYLFGLNTIPLETNDN